MVFLSFIISYLQHLPHLNLKNLITLLIKLPLLNGWRQQLCHIVSLLYQDALFNLKRKINPRVDSRKRTRADIYWQVLLLLYQKVRFLQNLTTTRFSHQSHILRAFYQLLCLTTTLINLSTLMVIFLHQMVNLWKTIISIISFSTRLPL